MNESRSARYHRARRRAAGAELAVAALLFCALVLTNGSLRLRDLAAGSIAAYVILLASLYAIVTLPLAWYRSWYLERQYDLSQMSATAWGLDFAKASALRLGVGVVAAEAVYAGLRWSVDWWWLLAAFGGAALLAIVTVLAPVCVVPLFHRSRPLARAGLYQRLRDLSERAGVPALTVHEWGLGESTRRAGAALVGAGATRRILLSDTLLAQYSDDEIEVVLAHEIAHHVHRDVLKSLAAEFLVMVAALYTAKVTLAAVWRPLGFASVDDVAALPLMLLAAGGVWLGTAPILNAWSRRNERRADQFALELTARPEAFIAAMKRMAVQNLAEERPTRVARWFFDTHPPVEERIGRARRWLDSR